MYVFIIRILVLLKGMLCKHLTLSFMCTHRVRVYASHTYIHAINDRMRILSRIPSYSLFLLLVGREKVCPMLLRIFCKFNEFHADDDFSYTSQPLDAEVCMHACVCVCVCT